LGFGSSIIWTLMRSGELVLKGSWTLSSAGVVFSVSALAVVLAGAGFSVVVVAGFSGAGDRLVEFSSRGGSGFRVTFPAGGFMVKSE
jgi:hypothetical protein